MLRMSRRRAVQAGLAACLAGALPREGWSTARPNCFDGITKAIPATGERLPVVGLGTNNYNVTTAEDIALRREVLHRMPQVFCGRVVLDTAPAYGRSELVVGDLLAEAGLHHQVFLATKVTAPGGDLAQGLAMFEESFRRLRTPLIDLMQVHNLDGADVLLPVLREYKHKDDATRIRYVGITTSNSEQYPQLIEAMRRHPIDFIQVDYSIDNRAAEEAVLPLAQVRGIAVLVNMPFGGRRSGNLFSKLAGRELPPWAGDVGAGSWAQFLLRYVVSHPAVTCAIPGTHRVAHLEDNLQAATNGVGLPGSNMRAKMLEFWQSIA
jgi:aryl-alcohol dehydrogenase-like predicted oxidoreductase